LDAGRGGAYQGGGSANEGGRGGTTTSTGASAGANAFGGGGGGSSKKNDCKDAFTEPLLDVDAINTVTPIGLVGGGGTEIVGRSYIFPRSDIEDEIQLFAPTAMTLIGGARYVPTGAPEGYHPDWALAFKPDCSSAMLIELYHVKNVVPALVEAIGDDIKPTSAWKSLPVGAQVHLDAGEQFGGYLLGPTSVAFDFIVRDDDVTNEFAEPARYKDSNILHVVCPYSYYPTELRSAFEQLLGAPGVGPVEGATCGSVAIDVVGSLAGQWFLNPDPATGRGNLSLTDGYGNPHPIGKNPDGSIVFGNVGPSQQGFRVYSDDASWRDPADVTDQHCYQLGTPGSPNGWLYYVIVSDSELKAFYSATGECLQTAPTEGGKTYYR
jgi:hypothetical protein